MPLLPDVQHEEAYKLKHGDNLDDLPPHPPLAVIPAAHSHCNHHTEIEYQPRVRHPLYHELSLSNVCGRRTSK